VVAGIEAGMGTEGLARLEQPIQTREPAGFERVGIECVGFCRLPQGQQLIAEAHHMGVGDVLEPQVESIGHGAAGLLSAEHTAIQETIRLLLRQPALRAHKAVAQLGAAAGKAQGGDHAVAIKGVMHPVAAALQPTRTVAIERALQLRRDGAADGCDRHPIQLHAHIAEGAGPVGAVVASGGLGGGRRGPSGGHGDRRRRAPIIA
jgi:hypothetical protein